jgi:hypothetical protein
MPPGPDGDNWKKWAHELIILAAIVLEPTDAIDIAATRTTTVSSKLHLAGDADVIVSGDQNLLTLKGAGKVRIVTPREFLEDRPGS